MSAKVPTVLGLDIGGANLKAATAAGRAVSVPFALWKQPDALPAALAALVAEFPGIDGLAVTMTGELCDCYATKREGVNRILDAVEFAAAGRPIRVWSVYGWWLSTVEAHDRPLEAAASNWHALATYAGRFAPTGNAFLIDIGSTTTDMIPLVDGVLTAVGRSDWDRLRLGELLYTGVKRTPVMALGIRTTCAELFADMRDVYTVCGMSDAEPNSTDTADGRPVDLDHCLARLARMFGADTESASYIEIADFALDCYLLQRAIIADAIRSREPTETATLIVSGVGEFLARASWEQANPDRKPLILSLAETLGPEVSACAPAYAVAVLASERPA